MDRFSKLAVSTKKVLKWVLGLLIINFIGLMLITLYSAYYSFGAMIFGVHTESAIKDFWSTEFIRTRKKKTTLSLTMLISSIKSVINQFI